MFDPEALERPFAPLAGLPAELHATLCVARGGDVAARAHAVLGWRRDLLNGRVPSTTAWPDEVFQASLWAEVERLGLARWCRGQAALTDRLIVDLVAAVRDGELGRQTEFERLIDMESDRCGVTSVSKEVRERCWQRACRCSGAVWLDLRAWEERVALWERVEALFGDLGRLMGAGWDLTPGILHHVGWAAVAALRALLERSDELRSILQTLGRLRHPREGASSVEIVALMTREVMERRVTNVPEDTRGLERSDDLARMLPTEMLLLRRPRLRLLWHARRMERALLGYRLEGELEREVAESATAKEVEPMRGPIVCVVDTSASMRGAPEAVAKALVLEAAATAHREGRKCLAFAFGTSGELVERELDSHPDSLVGLLDFLCARFGGGTDIEAMNVVLDRTESGRWRHADVLLVTDGLWQASSELISRARTARERTGLRVHGVHVGQGKALAMRELCDPIHCFADWSLVGTGT